MTVYISLAVAIFGLLLYILSPDTQPKSIEIGRISFFCGLLAFLLVYTRMVTL